MGFTGKTNYGFIGCEECGCRVFKEGDLCDKCQIKKLQAEIEMSKYVISKFEHWYSDNGCPLDEEGFCPCLDELKKEHDEEMEKLDEGDRFAFDPKEECGYRISEGWCYARYYEKQFETQKNLKGE